MLTLFSLAYFFVFLFGLIIGSFLNCLIYRLETGKNFLKGRSFCPYCKHILSWKDLIPLLSFIFLKGKCRYCGKKISLQYPLVELATGLIFILVFHFSISNQQSTICNLIFPISNQQSTISNLIFSICNLQSAICNLIISCFLIIIFVYDLKHYLIPDQIIYPAIALALFYQLFQIWNFGNWQWFKIFDLVFALLPSLFFLGIILLSKEKWMGFGDFKLAILMGLFLGWPKVLVALVLAFFIGAIFSLALIILGKKTMKSEIPFAPFLVTGTFLALLFGEKIIDWYLNLFLI